MDFGKIKKSILPRPQRYISLLLLGFVVQPLTAANELLPIEELKPLDVGAAPLDARSYHYGLSAANTYVNDSAVLKSGLFLGNYRPYFRLIYNERHMLNLRGRVIYNYNNSLSDVQRSSGSAASTGQYAVELANAEFNFDSHKLTAGRAFYKTGRGLLFANFADGAEYTGQFRYAKLTALAAYSAQYSGCTISLGGCGFSGQIAQKGVYDVTPGRTIDANLPDAGKRIFTSLEAQSPQYFGSSAYAMLFYSHDLDTSVVGTTNATTGAKVGQRYTFNPVYLGLGFSGFIVTPRLRYLTEGIYEAGTTYNRVNELTGTSQRVNVSAWGVTGDVNYALPFLESLFKPGLIFQYATGSGRQAKVATGANPALPAQQNDTATDNNFFYFGYYSAGLALKPKLSNLHVFRAGLQFRPLLHFHWGRNFMTVLKYSYYLKHNADYVISDPTAVVAKADVGHGLDAQLVYDLSSDLKIFYAYGAFVPGAAYLPSAEIVQIHILSVNLVF